MQGGRGGGGEERLKTREKGMLSEEKREILNEENP